MSKGKVLYYIFGDNSVKNIFNSKIKLKRKKCFLCSTEADYALKVYRKMIKEETFSNLYLIVDIMRFEKDSKNYDLLNTMNFFVISAKCKGYEILEKDCIIRKNKNNSSKIALKNNFVFMQEYSKEEDSANYYTVRFLINGIIKERDIYVMPEKEIEIDCKHQKGHFTIDYRYYQSISPKRRERFNLSDFKLKNNNQTNIKEIEVPEFIKKSQIVL